jgi:hypothetical protein
MLSTKSKARTFEYIAQVGKTAAKNDSRSKYQTFSRKQHGPIFSDEMIHNALGGN